MIKIDVVIPTKGETSFMDCVKFVRKYVPVNNLIVVTNKRARGIVGGLADRLVCDDRKNVGTARALGLKEVETEFYASVDSDVLLNPSWYDWCIKTIQDENVAACQGYAKPVARIYGPLQERFIRKGGGMYGKGFTCLGNTMLKTELVRKVGMPEIPVREDWTLRERLEKLGYIWVSNIDLQCMHLKTDVDIWKHAIWWGEMGGVKSLKPVATYTLKLIFIGWARPIRQNLFQIVERLCVIYGAFKGKSIRFDK